MKHPLRLAAVAGLVVIATVTTVVACSGSAPDRSESRAPSALTPVGSLAPRVKPDAGPTDVPNTVALRKDVSMTRCDRTRTGWSAGGTIDNVRAQHDYLITVYFVTQGGTVINHAATTVRVPGGTTAKWSARSTFVAPPALRCVLRGVA